MDLGDRPRVEDVSAEHHERAPTRRERVHRDVRCGPDVERPVPAGFLRVSHAPGQHDGAIRLDGQVQVERRLLECVGAVRDDDALHTWRHMVDDLAQFVHVRGRDVRAWQGKRLVYLDLERREARDAVGQQPTIRAQVPALVGATADGPAGLDDRQARAGERGVSDRGRVAQVDPGPLGAASREALRHMGRPWSWSRFAGGRTGPYAVNLASTWGIVSAALVCRRTAARAS